MIKRKYVVLLLLTLVSIPLTALFYSNLAQAQSTVTGYVSVSAAAFVPTIVTMSSINYGSRIENWEDGNQSFYGSVQLPNGSTVKNLTHIWYDTAGFVTCYLRRYNMNLVQTMAAAMSQGGGNGFSYDDTIDHATVDNSRYGYFLDVRFDQAIDHTDIAFKLAIIEYTLPSQAVGVGGFWIPVDKFSILAPYIISTIAIILVASITVAYIKYRKKQ